MHRRSSFRLVVTLALALALVPASPAMAAMSRTLVMARATTWADAVIPYSQIGWADLDGTIVTSPSAGWRRDCSGMVSMAWNLPRPGASTRTLAGYAERIEKEALQPGDMMLKEGSHALIFGGWVDDSRAEYWAYEMSSSTSQRTDPPDGTVRRRTPYPFWSNDVGYLPYRLKGITGSIDYTPYVTAVEGLNRYATSVAASRQAFADGSASTVVLASGENWPDALGAAALAGAVQGPVLLTRPGSIPAEVQAEIRRLGASEVIIVGGPGAVSADVENALTAVVGSTAADPPPAMRIGGSDRYETSRMIAAEVARRTAEGARAADRTVFIATGTSFPDALAASPIAYAHVRPIVLTPPDVLGADARSSLEGLEATSAVVLGGPAAVSADVEAALAEMLGDAGVRRLSGFDRYRTALAIARYGIDECGLTYGGLALANGTGFPDALAGGVMAGQLGTPLLLTPAERLNGHVADLLSANRVAVGHVRCLGGTAAIGTVARETVALMLQ